MKIQMKKFKAINKYQGSDCDCNQNPDPKIL